jgi:hypothetical protein
VLAARHQQADLVYVCRPGVERSDESPFVHDLDSVRQAQDLVELFGDQ